MIYEAGSTVVCNRCGETWRSDRDLEGYEAQPGRRMARLTEFAKCPNGHLDTHWVLVQDKAPAGGE